MTDRKSTLLALADRVQAGEVGSFLEREIDRITGKDIRYGMDLTISLDRIDALRERELPGSTVVIASETGKAAWISLVGDPKAFVNKPQECTTICAAYLSAVLRAIANKEQDHG